MGAAALGALGVGPTIVAGVGLALGIVPIVKAFTTQKITTTNSPLGWLLDVERKLGARATIEEVVALPLRPPG